MRPAWVDEALFPFESRFLELGDNVVHWADADIAFRAKELHRWETLMNRHHTVILPGAGHFLPRENPQAVVTALKELLPAPRG